MLQDLRGAKLGAAIEAVAVTNLGRESLAQAKELLKSSTDSLASVGNGNKMPPLGDSRSGADIQKA